MAAGNPNDTGDMTHFPGGISQHMFIGKGPNATTATVTGIKLARDKIVQVLYFVLSAMLLTAANDYTNEFSITADNTVTNTGGTNLSAGIILVTVARKG